MPVSVPAPTEAHTARPERRQRRRRRRRPAPASLAQPQGSQWQRWQPQPGRREVGVVGGGPCWIRPEGSPHRRRQRRGQSEFLWRSRGSFNMTVEDETGLCAAPILGFSGFASPAAPCHKKEELSAACWRLEPVAPQLASLQWVTAMETAERWRGCGPRMLQETGGTSCSQEQEPPPQASSIDFLRQSRFFPGTDEIK
ncbi:uncharacterized protein LOC128931746 isoform X2 [Callithrix jacchus]